MRTLDNKNWIANNGCIYNDTILKIESYFHCTLPNDYVNFMRLSNGGEGEVNGNYIVLWKMEYIVTLNSEYNIRKYLGSDFIAIGTDGGDEVYCLNISDNFSIFKCPLGDLDIESCSYITESFKKFMGINN